MSDFACITIKKNSQTWQKPFDFGVRRCITFKLYINKGGHTKAENTRAEQVALHTSRLLKWGVFMEDKRCTLASPLHCLWILAEHEMTKYQHHSSSLSSSFAHFSFITSSKDVWLKNMWGTRHYLCPRLQRNNFASQKSEKCAFQPVMCVKYLPVTYFLVKNGAVH